MTQGCSVRDDREERLARLDELADLDALAGDDPRLRRRDRRVGELELREVEVRLLLGDLRLRGGDRPRRAFDLRGRGPGGARAASYCCDETSSFWRSAA